MVTMEYDASINSEREKVSNFVRQRIAALNTARWKAGSRPPCSTDANGDMIICEDACTVNGDCPTCTNNASPATVLVESISDKDDNRKDILADEELQHIGCPICIACFAGMQSIEQVPRILVVSIIYFMGFLFTTCSLKYFFITSS